MLGRSSLHLRLGATSVLSLPLLAMLGALLARSSTPARAAAATSTLLAGVATAQPCWAPFQPYSVRIVNWQIAQDIFSG